jgi:hypothetical protein
MPVSSCATGRAGARLFLFRAGAGATGGRARCSRAAVLAGGRDGYLISRGAWSWPVLGAAGRRSVAAVRRSIAAVRRRSVAAVRRSIAAVRRRSVAAVRRSIAAVRRRSVAAVRRSVAAVRRSVAAARRSVAAVRRPVAAAVRRFVTAVRRSVAAVRVRNHTVRILSARGDENSDKCASDKQQEPVHWIRPRSHRCSTSKSLIGLSERYEIETDPLPPNKSLISWLIGRTILKECEF